MGAARAGDATGAAAPLPTPARYTAHGLPRPITLSPPERHRIFRQVFRIFSGKYPEYLFPISAPVPVQPSAPLQHRKQRRQALNPGTIIARRRAKPDLPTPAMLPTARRFPLATESPI